MADVTEATFETDVIERSSTVPVVVDLWAEWCGPCRALTPILEKVIGETQGLVELAKVNTEENPAVYAAFQVQGIPAVFAFIDGKIVDGFIGAKPEREVVEFVQRLLDIKAGKVPLGGDGEEHDDGDAAEGETPDDGAVISEPGDATAESEPTPALSDAEGDEVEAELKELLTKVKGDEEAREAFLALLEKLGPDDPRTNTYRRKLATALF